MNAKRLLNRRTLILGGAAAAGGWLLPEWCRKNLPPTYGSILRMGDNLTYASHRLLLPGQSMVREYGPRDISSFPVIFLNNNYLTNTAHPMLHPDYKRLHADGYRNWELTVEGEVEHPKSFSLAELKALPARTQITRHTCEEGWSAIGQWTGVQLSQILEVGVGLKPNARYVTFHSDDAYVDCIDLLDALHPQTLLAYDMNGRPLTIPHGSPLRLRVERQLGYRSMKYVRKIVVTDVLDDGGKDGNIQNGWSWYAGI